MLRKLIFFYILIFFSVFIGTLVNTQAMFRQPTPDDPVARISYRKAFDQKEIHRRFAPLMRNLACAANVFQDEDQGVKKISSSSFELSNPNDDPRSSYETIVDINENSFEDLDEWKEYENVCLTKLKKERRWAITEEGRNSLTTIAIIILLTASGAEFLGIDSVGGSFIISAAFFNSVVLLRDIISSSYNLIFTPSHPLDELEKRFAKNQCFIPQELWTPLIDSFMTARQNSVGQEKSINFIEFTLGLTTYRPIVPIVLRDDGESAIEEIHGNLNNKIDAFFQEYSEIIHKEYINLKTNIFKFVLSLLDRGKLSRYIYLYGEGGIGKTYFIRQLCNWIKEYITDSVHFENIVITTPEELEGSANKPGVFLRLLRNQCLARKKGSVLLMDEANWLNKEVMISPAKRVFNGELAQLSTSYFGPGIDGAGVQLEIPPMLVILSANEPIQDEPLRSRFDLMKFPLPTQEALVEYGKKLLAQESLRYLSYNNPRNFSLTIEDIQDYKSFREIEAAIPLLMERERHQQTNLPILTDVIGRDSDSE